MKLYGSTLSPFVRKVMAYAAEKGLALELEPAGMGRGGPDFLRASPFRKMPGFCDGDFAISDSTAIITYLEAKYPQPALIPEAPEARAQTIWFEEFGDTIVAKAGGAMFFNRVVSPLFLKQPGDTAAADKAEAEDLPPILDYLDSVVPDSGFLVEDRLTLADIAVASPFVNYRHLGVTIDSAAHPRAAGYIDAILARPSFAGMIAGETAFLAKMRG
jgi:glutathione S-transferase